MQVIEGGITAAKGFMASSTAAGIKYAGRQDMALLYCEKPCIAAGAYTKNIVQAAPVLWDKQITDGAGRAQAVVINAGIANACTGEEGYAVCRKTADAAAEALGIPAEAVLTASTGVIGKQIPIDKITNGIRQLAGTLSGTIEAGTSAAEAIMTTDTKKKEIAVSFESDGKMITIGGMCKGSGMIHINMCTMLGFITTDAAISRELLQKALKEDIEDTFNMVTVDGDTSTNDTVLLLASGMAGNREITKEGEAYSAFCSSLHIVTEYLAKRIAEDGEGATKLLEVEVIQAETKQQAVRISKSVAASSLVKTAVYGNDANWGRILCAMGYSEAAFIENQVDVTISCKDAAGLKLVENGLGTDYSEETAAEILSADAVTITIDLKMGSASAKAFGCDLTYDYIRINADYRS